jgi:hypothetical protein
MRFNNFTINRGDSKNSIIEKINNNFSQILSFSSGPKGRDGEVGATGYPGSAGPKGSTGTTGTRASEWSSSLTQPLAPNYYDLWIDQSATGNSDVYSYDSSWNSTGLSLVDSDFFSVKNSIPTFTTGTDYSAIYFSGSNQANQSLVISDTDQGASTVNPNYSKLLISTKDQIEKPILSFRKSNIPDGSTPSFYWGSTGQNSRLKLKSDYEIKISSDVTFFYPRSEPGSLFPTITATGDVYLTGRNLTTNSGDMSLIGPQYWRAAGNLDIDLNGSSGLVVSQEKMEFGSGFTVFGSFSSSPLASLNQPEGVSISRGQTANNDLMRLQHGVTTNLTTGLKDILKIRQNTITRTDQNTGETIQSVGGSMVIGGTSGFNIYSGGNIDSPTGPFAYHTVGCTYITNATWGSFIVNPGGYVRYYLDITNVSNYYTDSLLITGPTGYPGFSRHYIKIPKAPATVPQQNYYPLWGTNYHSEYRIMVNPYSQGSTDRRIYGVVWDQLRLSGTGVAYNTNQYVQFDSPCPFFDLFYFYNSDGQIYAYIKTCSGQSIPIAITNYSGFIADRVR